MQCTSKSDTRDKKRRKREGEIKMESKALEASGKSAEQRRAERRQKAVIGENLKQYFIGTIRILILDFKVVYGAICKLLVARFLSLLV